MTLPAPVHVPSPPERQALLRAAGVTGLHFVERVPFGPGGAELWRLDNGLEVILAHDSAVGVAAVHTWVKAGSADEAAGKSGLAHLFEHLMFKSTTTRPAGTFDRELERHGASANAATWFDWTMYHEVVPASEVPAVLELEADRLTALALTPAALRSELEVVRNERRETLDDDPDGQVDEALWRAVFGSHPYGRPVIGETGDLATLGLDDAVAFYRARYVPPNVAVVVAGGFDVDAVLRAVATHHGKLPRPASLPPRAQPTALAAPAAAVDLAIDASAARLAVAWRTVPLAHPDHAALALAAEALCGAESSRWYRALVDVERLASGVSCHQSDLRLAGLFEVRLTLRPAVGVDLAVQRLEALVAGLVGDRPLTAAEVEGARLRLQTGRLRELTSVDGRAEVLGTAWAAASGLGDGEHWWQRIARLDATAVNRALRSWLVSQSRSVVRASPAAVPPVQQGRARRAAAEGGRG